MNIVSHEIAEKTSEEAANYPVDTAKQFLSEIRRILDKEEPDYINWYEYISYKTKNN